MIDRNAIAAIVGAGGGIGSALVQACRDAGFARVATFSRHPGPDDFGLDLEHEPSIAQAAASLAGATPRLVVVATGLLHAPGIKPEKTYRALDPDVLATLFRINTIGPALVAKHFLPALASPGLAVFAVLSARVGSISDNRLGGWHGYRASKAALNMIVRNLAIEVARTRPDQVCVALHPGTVSTRLSAPFAPRKLIPPLESARNLLAVLDGLTPDMSGRCLAFDGSEVPP